MVESDKVMVHLISDNRSNPSTEHLLSTLLSYRHTIALLEDRCEKERGKCKRLKLCAEKLDEAEAAITKYRLFKKIFLAWDMLHHVSEELILLLEPAELAAEGEKLALDIKMSTLPEAVQNTWITKIKNELEKLTLPESTEAEIQSARQTIKMALNTLNGQTDSLFWDLWTKKFSCLIYTVSLIFCGAVFLALYSTPSGFRLCISNVLLIGAIGGVASGIMSADPQYIAKGHFWVSTLYYSLVRPAQGALAALVVFWMLQSQYLIKIDPPLESASVAFSCDTSSKTTSQTDKTKGAGIGLFSTVTSLKPGAQLDKVTVAGNTEAAKNSNTLIILNAAKGKEIYLYLLVLLLSGFSGDKILKSVSDKTLAKLYTEADKNKDATAKN